MSSQVDFQLNQFQKADFKFNYFEKIHYFIEKNENWASTFHNHHQISPNAENNASSRSGLKGLSKSYHRLESLICTLTFLFTLHLAKKSFYTVSKVHVVCACKIRRLDNNEKQEYPASNFINNKKLALKLHEHLKALIGYLSEFRKLQLI